MPHLIAICGALVGSSTAYSDVVIANFEHDNLFNYRIDHMPDLDQRRDTLFNEGRSHCYPTATLNLILYAANHGFDDVQPGPKYWQAQENYLTATGLIATMGSFMQTDIDGTNGSNAVAGLEWYLAFQPDYFTINHHLTTPGYTTNFVNVAKSVISGNIGTVSYGRYDILDYQNGIPRVQRDNGHVTTIARCYRNGNDMRIWVRDPSSTDPLDVQSQFSNRLIELTTITVMMMDNQDPPNEVGERTMTALNYDPTADRVALMDGHMSIRPQTGYSFDSSIPAIRVNMPNGFAGGNTPTHQDIPSPNGVIFDASFNPLLQEFFVIAGDPNQQQLYRVDLFGNSTQMQLPATPKIVRAAANGSTIILMGDGSVRHISSDLTTVAQTQLPMNSFSLNFTKIAYKYLPPAKAGTPGSFAPQGVVLLLSDDRKVLFYPMDLSEPVVRDLPTLIPGNVLDMMIDPQTQRIWLITDASNTLYGVKWDASGNANMQFFTHPEIDNPSSVNTNDLRGKILRIRVNPDNAAQTGPHVKVFKGESGAWVLDPDSPFHNLPVAGTFRMMQSSSNYDPAIHDHPSWTTQVEANEPGDLGPSLADCAADVVPDDQVNVSDLLAVINSWGPSVPGINPADVNGNGGVGVDDLLIVINNWGPCY